MVIILMILLPVCSTRAAEPGAEAMLLERINQARINPLAEAVRLGYDAASLLNDLPELATILENGLPPLASSYRLDDTALNHTADMLSRHFYSQINPDGLTPADRIQGAGFQAVATGESLGLVAFINFMPAEKAVDILFSNIFKKELKAGPDVQRKILNPQFTAIGIGVLTGPMVLNGNTLNTYVATCDFARTSELDLSRNTIARLEGNLLNLINQFRSAPLVVSQRLGFDVETFVTSDPALGGIFQRSVPPLVPNSALEAASNSHISAILSAGGYTTSSSLVDPAVQARMRAAGYPALRYVESVQAIEVSDMAHLSQISYDLMNHLILEAIFDYHEHGTFHLLDPSFEDIGLGIAKGMLKFNGSTVDTILLSLTLGADDQPNPVYIMGNIFIDHNGDQLHTLGEEITGISIGVRRIHPISGVFDPQTMQPNPSGSFFIAVPESGEYQLSFNIDDDQPVIRRSFIDTDNEWICLRADEIEDTMAVE